MLNNTQLNALLAHAETMYTIVDGQNNFVYLNDNAADAAKRFAGRNPQIGDALKDYINPNLVQQLFVDIETVRSGSEVKRTVSLAEIEPDRAGAYFSYNLSLLPNSNEYLVMEAVTYEAFEEMQRAIAERKSYLDNIFDAIGTGIKIIDVQGKILDTNHAYERMCGKNKETLVGSQMTDSLHPAERDIAKRQLKDFVLNGVEPKRDWLMLRANGGEVLVDLTIRKALMNGETRLILSLNDISKEHSLKEELTKSSKRTNALINNLSILLWSVDSLLRFQIANQTATKYFKNTLGYNFTPGENLKEAYKLHGKERLASREVLYVKVLTTGIPQQFETLDFIDGQIQHLSGQMHPVLDGDNCTGVTCFMEDDTDQYLRRRFSNGLNKFEVHCAKATDVNEVFMHLVKDILSNLYIQEGEIVQEEGGVLKPNVVYRRGAIRQNPNIKEIDVFEIKTGDGIVGAAYTQKATVLVEDTAKDPRVIGINKMFASEIAVPIMVEGEVFAIINCESEATGFFKPIFKEILESAASEAGGQIRKLLDKAKLESIERLHGAILNSTPNGFLLLNENYQIQSFNKTAQEMVHGFFNETIKINDSYLNYILPDYTADFKAAVSRGFKGELVREEYELNHPKRGVIWVQFTFAPAYKNERVFGVTMIVENITGKKQTEQLILEQNFNLKKANKELDKFVYSISHDVRAPLASIEGLAGLINMSTSVEEAKKYTDLIHQSTQKLDTFIRNILSYSRNNKQPNRPEKLNVYDEVREVIGANRYLDNFEDIEFDIEVSKETSVEIDPFRFKLILDSIISNAIKYHTLKNRKKWIKVEISVANKVLNISIKDNGQGIEKEHLSKVFDMFFTANKRARGNGIGLYILKDTVRFLNGEIHLSSEPKNGTEVNIQLPLNNT